MRKYGALLIVDDEKDIGRILSDAFSPVFEKVIFCDNAQEALGVLKATSLSAVITDMNMPGLNGKDLIVKMRSDGNLTPVIIITGYLNQDMAVAALRLGVADILEKPFSSEEIISKVDRVLEIEKRQRFIDKGDVSNLEQKKKIVGLLQVVNENVNVKKSS